MTNKKIIFSLALIYALTAFISFHIPMNSDDYAYALRNLSLSSAIGHYMGWSGRLLSDFISTSLLTLFPRPVCLAINALVLPSMTFFMAKAAAVAGGRRVSPSVVVFIFLLYFLANPSLGQTTFWIVGSANYLWTNMFISAFVALSLWLQQKQERISSWLIIIFFMMSILAGCSNENTSIVVVVISVFIFLIEKNKKLALIGVVGNVIGAAILLLSPGNTERAKTVSEWYDTPMVARIFTHFSERLPEVMGSYWQVYIAIIVLLIAALMSGVSNRRLQLYCLIFIISAFLANIAFAFSPGMPERAWNGGFCFMIMATAFAASMAFGVPGKTAKTINITLYLSVIVYFLITYIFYFTSVSAIKHQTEIREMLIEKAKHDGKESVDIPDYYFPPVMHKGPSLDTFNSQFMSKFYRININVVGVKFFDYSRAFLEKPIIINSPVLDGLMLKNIWLFKEQVWIKNYIIYEFNKDPADVIKPGIGMFIHIKDTDGNEHTLDVEPRSLIINGRFLSGINAGNVSVSNAHELIVGTWDGNTGKRLTENHFIISK